MKTFVSQASLRAAALAVSIVFAFGLFASVAHAQIYMYAPGNYYGSSLLNQAVYAPSNYNYGVYGYNGFYNQGSNCTVYYTGGLPYYNCGGRIFQYVPRYTGGNCGWYSTQGAWYYSCGPTGYGYYGGQYPYNYNYGYGSPWGYNNCGYGAGYNNAGYYNGGYYGGTSCGTTYWW